MHMTAGVSDVYQGTDVGGQGIASDTNSVHVMRNGGKYIKGKHKQGAHKQRGARHKAQTKRNAAIYMCMKLVVQSYCLNEN